MKLSHLFSEVLGIGFRRYGYWVSKVPGIKVWVLGFTLSYNLVVVIIGGHAWLLLLVGTLVWLASSTYWYKQLNTCYKWQLWIVALLVCQNIPAFQLLCTQCSMLCPGNLTADQRLYIWSCGNAGIWVISARNYTSRRSLLYPHAPVGNTDDWVTISQGLYPLPGFLRCL